MAGAGALALTPSQVFSANTGAKLKKNGFISGIAEDAMNADWESTLNQPFI